MDLLSQWSKATGEWNLGSDDYVLGADANFLRSLSPVSCHKYEEAMQALGSNESTPGTRRSPHIGLIPIPFMGDLLNASIYVFMTNPGIKGNDYRECEEPSFKRALVANLKQETLSGTLPFTYLDFRFDWHAGHRYWDRKLRGIIQALAESRAVSYTEARDVIGHNLAVLQLFPYHSAQGPSDKTLKNCTSVRLVKEFVGDTVIRRVRANQATVIVVHKVKSWNQYLPEDLTEEQGVIRMPANRNFSFKPTNPWGQAILRRLDAMD